MCILEKLNFKISRGSIPPDLPSVFAPLLLDPVFDGLTLNCFRQACYYQCALGNTLILLILITQKDVSLFSVEIKGAPSILYRDIYFKDC